MSSISFKANLVGIENPDIEMVFRQKTFFDTKHTLTYLGKDPDMDCDVFSLSKDGKTTIDKYPVFRLRNNDEEFNIKQIFKIFNILKIKEAQAFVNKSIKDKKAALAKQEEQELLNETAERQYADLNK